MSNYEKKCFDENRGKMWQPLKEWKLEGELEMIKGNFTRISSSKQTSIKDVLLINALGLDLCLTLYDRLC